MAGAADPRRVSRPLSRCRALRQPAAERRHGPAELLGRLLVGQPFEVAEHDRQALASGRRSISSCRMGRRSWSVPTAGT